MTVTPTAPACRVCGSHEVSGWLRPKEMMFGFREMFDYFRCGNCGCLQVAQIPPNLKRYYPENYCPYANIQEPAESFTNWLKRRFASGMMTRYKLGWGSPLGWVACRFREGPPVPEWLRFLARPLPLRARILDVGCGNGQTLLALRNCGFRQLRGMDPFITNSLSYQGGVRVDKCHLHEVSGQFELIMFHHVFEHLEEPIEALRNAAARLCPRGRILVRIPLSDSSTARDYAENWVQLDAPRHLFLHTRKSMQLAAARAGLSILSVVYDSWDFQFWGSEQYLLDIPLFDPHSYAVAPAKARFTSAQILEFKSRAVCLNRQENGDQAAFILAVSSR